MTAKQKLARDMDLIVEDLIGKITRGEATRQERTLYDAVVVDRMKIKQPIERQRERDLHRLEALIEARKKVASQRTSAAQAAAHPRRLFLF